MNRTELKKIVAIHPAKEYLLKDLKCSITLFRKVALELTGIIEVFEYLEKQVKGYESIEDPLTSELDFQLQHIRLIFQEVRFYAERIESFGDFNQAAGQWSKSVSKINQYLQKLVGINTGYLPFDYPEVSFLIKLSSENNPRIVSAAFQVLYGIIPSPQNKDNFLGILHGLQFDNKNFTNIDLSKHEAKGQKKLEQDIRDFKRSLDEESAELHGRYSDLEESWNKQNVEVSDGLKQAFGSWFAGIKTEQQEFTDTARGRIGEIEETYTKLLELSKPAEYWNRRALKLRTEAKSWMWWLIGFSFVSILILTIVLSLITKESLATIFESTGSAVRWSVVFVTLVSFLAYGIRTFAKLLFSSLHLARDAEEREQLVFVYLSLIENGGADQESRLLILQSIFSRSDSGLLKEDSSPTMPGGFLGKLSSEK